MIDLPRVLAAAGEIQSFCLQQCWRFCFIGGVAVQRWGEPRFTQLGRGQLVRLYCEPGAFGIRV